MTTVIIEVGDGGNALDGMRLGQLLKEVGELSIVNKVIFVHNTDALAIAKLEPTIFTPKAQFKIDNHDTTTRNT